MSDDKELDVSKVSRVEAYYSHGMSWDIDAICKEFKLDIVMDHIKQYFSVVNIQYKFLDRTSGMKIIDES